jgi:uncharacterized membrane protein
MYLHKILLLIHVILAIIGLVAGTIVLFLKKGDKRHKQLGKVFMWNMLTTAFIALILAAIKSSLFLFIVGVFSIYLIGTGTRFIQLKLNNEVVNAKWMDWALTIFMAISGVIFIIYGTRLLLVQKTFGWVLITFGIIGGSGVFQDLRYYRGLKKEKMYWLRTHISRMTGGYIAAFTAFIVNNMGLFPQGIPGFVFWLLPTFILVPLIIKWQRQYVKK